MKSNALNLFRTTILSLSVVAVTTKASGDDLARHGSSPAAATTLPATHFETTDQLLDAVDAAYKKLDSAKFIGVINGDFQVGGVGKKQAVMFNGSFTGPNRFRHDSEDLLITSDGTKLFSFLKKRMVYQSASVPKARAAVADWPEAVVQSLSDQDPSLLLAVVPSAKDYLKQWSAGVELDKSASSPTLKLPGGDGKPEVTLEFDPQTLLLHTATYDYAGMMKKAGTADVTRATVQVFYFRTDPDAGADAGQYAWVPPADAALVTAGSVNVDTADGADATASLVGQPAPDFKLSDLHGEKVQLSTLKGSVVVLDLWATWCGPCKASLPGLDEMNKELGPQGLKFYAIDLQEDQETIEKLLKQTGWTFPVLLDGDGAVAKKYKCNGIPQTMVIDKTGVVKKVFVGMGHDPEVQSLVKELLKAD